MEFNPKKYLKGCYQLPGDPAKDLYLCPVSGGADSAALAIMMHAMFPSIPFVYLFTDTLADEDEIYETLSAIEKWTGRVVTRIEPKDNKGLYELIEDDFNGFLPSSQQRWCTRILKLESYERFISTLNPPHPDGKIWSFIGIRYDEPWRVGMISDKIEAAFPFKGWQMVRSDIFSVLDETIGIPRFYTRRTRSGCFSCWGMRRSESIGLLQWKPVEFQRAKSFEKLSSKDLAKSRTYASAAEELGTSLNWVGFPIPAELDIRSMDAQKSEFSSWQFHEEPAVGQSLVEAEKRWWRGDVHTDWTRIGKVKKSVAEQLSLFELDGAVVRLWAAVEFRIDPGIGGDGVFWQEFITFSSSKSGLVRQIQGHYEHRKQTAEAIHETEDGIDLYVKFGVYCIEADVRLLDVSGTEDGSYCWKRGESYDMIERLTSFAKRSLHIERVRQDLRIAEREGKVQRAAECRKMLDGVVDAYGKVVGMSKFVPAPFVPVDPELVTDEEYVPCFACSV